MRRKARRSCTGPPGGGHCRGDDAGQERREGQAPEQARARARSDGQHELGDHVRCRDALAVVRDAEGDREDRQGGSVVEEGFGLEDRAACGSDALAERRDRRRVGGPQAGSDKECSTEGKPEGDADARDNARGDNDEDGCGQDDAAQCPLHAHERDRQGFPVQEEWEEDRQDDRGGERSLGNARDERGPRARCDEEYRADQVESVGQEDAAHSGDSEDDDCFDGHGSPFGWDSPLTVRRYCARVCTGGVACGTCGNRWVG